MASHRTKFNAVIFNRRSCTQTTIKYHVWKSTFPPMLLRINFLDLAFYHEFHTLIGQANHYNYSVVDSE